MDDGVLARGEEQRQRRRPLAQIGAGDLARIDRLAGAVQDVVGDLEGDPERQAELGQLAGLLPSQTGAEQAGGLEELPGLERAALEVALDRRLRIVGLGTLERLAPCKREACRRKRRNGAFVSGRRELGERAGEQVVARSPGGARPEPGPRRRAPAAVARTVDQVVVHERGHVHELDGDAGDVRRLAVGGGREEDQQGPQALAAGRERLGPDHRGKPRMAADRVEQPLLDLFQILVEPLCLVDRRQRAHAATPLCRATIPPPKRR